MTSSKKQIPYLHYLRVVAIFMVLALHSISPYMSNAQIYGKTSWYAYLIINSVARGGVPLFFMISGHLLLNNDLSREFKPFYTKRLSRVLIPLAIWNVIYYVFYCALNGEKLSLGSLLSQSMNSGTAYHFWYLYTLAGIYLVTPFLKRLTDSCSLKQLVWLEVLICFCTTIRPFANTVLPIYIFWFDPLFNGYIGFFLLGYILGQCDFSKSQTRLFLLGGITGLAISVLGNHITSSEKAIDLSFNSGYNLCWFLIGSAFFVTFKDINFNRGTCFKIIKSLSEASFGIYIVHVGVMDLISRFALPDASPIVLSAYLFASSSVISVFLSYGVGKVKYLS